MLVLYFGISYTTYIVLFLRNSLLLKATLVFVADYRFNGTRRSVDCDLFCVPISINYPTGTVHYHYPDLRFLSLSKTITPSPRLSRANNLFLEMSFQEDCDTFTVSRSALVSCNEFNQNFRSHKMLLCHPCITNIYVTLVSPICISYKHNIYIASISNFN